LCRYTETIDDLRALHDKKERKILSKQQMYAGFRGKLNVSAQHLYTLQRLEFFSSSKRKGCDYLQF